MGWSDGAARHLSELVSRQYVPYTDDTIWVTDDISLLREYAIELQRRGAVRVSCRFSVLGWRCSPKAEERLPTSNDAPFLGFDVNFPSLSYPFISVSRDHGREELRTFVCEHLNAHGYMPNESAVARFMALYAASPDYGAKLETLEGARAVPVWDDPGGRFLKRLLAG
jgi:hypothetical protein